jgi:negative regulator of sigma-B (phosphoserine phosphatase)
VVSKTASLSRPCAGETENGDRAFVRVDGAREAFAVIDALGHGPLASAAAKLAIETLERVSLADPLDRIFAAVHTALQGSRGAAMVLVIRQGDLLHAAGIGNVALRSSISFVPTNGVLGSRFRPPRIASGAASGRLILHSDGISHRFETRDYDGKTPAEVCRLLLDQHGASHDDATVLVVDL